MWFLVLAAFVAFTSAARSPKRGFVGDGCKGADCQDLQLLTGASWYYAYNPSDPFAPSGGPYHDNFVPMHW